MWFSSEFLEELQETNALQSHISGLFGSQYIELSLLLQEIYHL